MFVHWLGVPTKKNQSTVNIIIPDYLVSLTHPYGGGKGIGLHKGYLHS